MPDPWLKRNRRSQCRPQYSGILILAGNLRISRGLRKRTTKNQHQIHKSNQIKTGIPISTMWELELDFEVEGSGGLEKES